MEKEQIKRSANKTITRTNSDIRMIVTGILVLALYLLIGLMSIESNTYKTKPKNRGPVKDPLKTGCLETVEPRSWSYASNSWAYVVSRAKKTPSVLFYVNDLRMGTG